MLKLSAVNRLFWVLMCGRVRLVSRHALNQESSSHGLPEGKCGKDSVEVIAAQSKAANSYCLSLKD